MYVIKEKLSILSYFQQKQASESETELILIICLWKRQDQPNNFILEDTS